MAIPVTLVAFIVARLLMKELQSAFQLGERSEETMPHLEAVTRGQECGSGGTASLMSMSRYVTEKLVIIIPRFGPCHFMKCSMVSGGRF